MHRTPIRLIAPAVAGLQTLVLMVLALITLIGSAITREFEARILLPELLLYALFTAGLAWVTRGLWLSRSWAKAPMIAVQLIVIGIAYEDFWQSERGLWQVFAIFLVAVAGFAIFSSLKIPGREK